jgi:Protein of unknown function (DUF3987)
MSNIVQDYMELTEGTEVPDMFNVWGGYVLVSACISRRVWYMHGFTPIYPNIYSILVGDAGNGKTMAIRSVRDILSDVGNIAIANAMETPEGLIRRLAGDFMSDPPVEYRYAFKTMGPRGDICDVSPVTILASEFINFIGRNESWINILNDVYDAGSQFDYNTKNQGHDIINGPYFVLMGGLTTETSFDMQKKHIIQSGFARRTIFQYGERRFDTPQAFPPGESNKLELRRSIIERCRLLQRLQGEIIIPQVTRDFYREWYDDHSLNVCRTAPPHIKSWANSKSVQVLKIAMLTSLAESHDLCIRPRHIQSALDLFENMEKDLYSIFGGTGRNELASVAVKIANYLRSQESALELKLLENRFFTECRPPNDFAMCIGHLQSSGEAVIHQVSKGGVPTTYIGTPLIMSAFAEANRPPTPPPPPADSFPPSAGPDSTSAIHNEIDLGELP